MCRLDVADFSFPYPDSKVVVLQLTRSTRQRKSKIAFSFPFPPQKIEGYIIIPPNQIQNHPFTVTLNNPIPYNQTQIHLIKLVTQPYPYAYPEEIQSTVLIKILVLWGVDRESRLCIRR